MSAVIKLTLPGGAVEYVESEYGLTPDINQARVAYNNSSSSALLRRWTRFCAPGGGRYIDYEGAAVEIVPINIVPI
jgi:hypothetical protein